MNSRYSEEAAIAFDWYREFLSSFSTSAYTWFGSLIAYGELLIGIASSWARFASPHWQAAS